MFTSLDIERLMGSNLFGAIHCVPMFRQLCFVERETADLMRITTFFNVPSILFVCFVAGQCWLPHVLTSSEGVN